MGEEPLPPVPPTPIGVLRAVLRGVPLLLLIAGGLGLMLLLRLVERPLCHPRRPVTPAITVAVCRGTLGLLGLRVERIGTLDPLGGAIVANHSSWLDIFVLNAMGPVRFVAKSEVAGWAGIGWLARATGTLFIRRERRGETAAQVAAMAERLRAGERLVFFPEGTSTDGLRVLPFKPTLFAGLLDPALPSGLMVQPVTLSWRAPKGEDPRFYGWWGGVEFLPSFLAILMRPGGSVRITCHAALPVAGQDRKALARETEALVRSAL
jgi:lyso-ornithine lipid O-acyltransferase